MEVPSVFEPIDRNDACGELTLKGSGSYLMGWQAGCKQRSHYTGESIYHGLLPSIREFNYTWFSTGDELINQVKELLSASPGPAERITLVGKVEHDELIYWFNSVDFVISTSHYEGSGIAVCEAMSCGCIPILTNIPSFRMMTGNGRCGIIFTPGVVDDLFQALVKSTEMTVLSERKKVLEQHRQHLSADAISEKMVDTFRENSEE